MTDVVNLQQTLTALTDVLRREKRQRATRWGCTFTVLGFFLVPLRVFLYGWTLAVLWKWFAVPLGLPVVSWSVMAGFHLIVRLLQESNCRSASQDEEKDPDERVKKMAHGFLLAALYHPAACGFALLIGWVLVTYFVGAQ